MQLAGFALGGGGRSTSFMKDDFMKKNFGKEHEEEVGGEVSKQGYPDAGSGRYSKKLPYHKWYKYNLRQRAHGNYLETIL